MTPNVNRCVNVSASTVEASKIDVLKKNKETPESIPKSAPVKKNLNTTDIGGAWSKESPL